jgi:modification methylase
MQTSLFQPEDIARRNMIGVPRRPPGSSTRELSGSVELERLLPQEALHLMRLDSQTAVPGIARRPDLTAEIERSVQSLSTDHQLWVGDSRDLDRVPDESVHLVVTSPPYWTLKEYLPHESQLGSIADYEEFLVALDAVWQQCFRVLVPGGRLIVVVGDVCLSRKRHGRHMVVALHAAIQEHCRHIGFDNLAPIFWYKIANAAHEVENGSGGFLGKPYEPGGVIKNDVEYILLQRKPGGYRKPTEIARLLSIIPEQRHRAWFQQIWTGLTGASTRHHPAPYPVALAERLIRMFSFVDDIVLDPFMGTGSTNAAAAMWGRNSIGVELHSEYFDMAVARMTAIDGAKLSLPD